MIKAERQQEILYLLAEGGTVGVTDLAERFKISPLTVRRDLMDLQAQGLLSRTHGGAKLDAELHAYSRYEGGSFEDRAGTHGMRKRRIAERAAALVSDGDSLFINAGSTNTEFARALRHHQNLHVATNGLTVALEMGKNPSAMVYVLPGALEKKKMATLFNSDATEVASLRAPSAFLGVVGISTADGPLMLTMQEATMTRALINASAEVTILADSSKFEASAMYRVAPIAMISRIITDDALGQSDRERLERAGIDVILVPSEEEVA